MKKPWQSVGAFQCGLGERRGFKIWSYDFEPQETFAGVENAWEGEIPKRGKVPSDECFSATGAGAKGRWHAFLSGFLGTEDVVLASSKRLVVQHKS